MKSFNVFLTEASIPQFKFNSGARNVVKGLEQLGSNDPKKDALKVMEIRRIVALSKHLIQNSPRHKGEEGFEYMFNKKGLAVRDACEKEVAKLLPSNMMGSLGSDRNNYKEWVTIFNNMDLGINITEKDLPLLMGKGFGTYKHGHISDIGDVPGKGGLGVIDNWIMNDSDYVRPEWKKRSPNMAPGQNPYASNFMN